jgi:hypothetical protein
METSPLYLGRVNDSDDGKVGIRAVSDYALGGVGESIEVFEGKRS